MPLVVGLTRGGVAVGSELARILHAPFDICIVRKLTSLRDPASWFGALAEGGATFVDMPHAKRLGLGPIEITTAVEHARREVERLQGLFRDRPAINARGFDAILVDDGLVGVEQIRAAVLALRSRGVHAIELAIPVASTAAIDAIQGELDHVTCLETDPYLTAVGARYQEFRQVSDAEVMDALAAAHVHIPFAPVATSRVHT